MANFDHNQWYQIYLEVDPGVSIKADVLAQTGAGVGQSAIYAYYTDTASPSQQWQLFAFNSSYHVIRNRNTGPTGYLGTFAQSSQATIGGSTPNMRNYTLSDNSMFWQIQPWADGTSYLTNAANGTGWHLTYKATVCW
jgi:hypothetical protein